jgi:allophanate hydrolase
MKRPTEAIAEAFDRIEAERDQPVWISLVPREIALAQARALESDPAAAARPLYGVPFAIKDNIDLAGVPTTAGCPAYAYTPERSAPVVQRLIDAGAIPVGKTNMDQFATGLVGTRSPHGACSSVFDRRYISGGSSSGSAVAVALGMASFSLGTDTAGSGRVPAAFNGIVGLKPTRGMLSTSGVVPACRTLDCVSIFAPNCAGARAVFEAARGFDGCDPFSRVPRAGEDAAPWLAGEFRFGVPAANQLQFFGDYGAAALYAQACARLEAIGGRKVEIDFSIFRAAADLLYSGPWVAERYAAIREFIETHATGMNPVVRGIIEGARKYSAADAFAAEYRLRELKRASEAEWARMDVMALPTAGTIYTHEAVAAEPVRLNTNLGYYTNFVNLLDLAAVAVPVGVREDAAPAAAPVGRTSGPPLSGPEAFARPVGRSSGPLGGPEAHPTQPFGISLIGPAFSDGALLALGGRFCGEPIAAIACPPGCVAIAVVGAHLSGQPLNWQLTGKGARLIRTCRTAPNYRLYALEGTKPAKPGLVRDDTFRGPGIEVEVWAMPEHEFGGFTAGVPAPLGIGNAALDDGTSVKCFICEPYGIAGATEITRFGGWRAYQIDRSAR